MKAPTPEQRERMEAQLLALRHKFTVCWMVAMPQLIVGWASLGGGTVHWRETGEFFSFRMIFGIVMLFFLAATLLYTRPVYLRMVKLREQLLVEE